MYVTIDHPTYSNILQYTTHSSIIPYSASLNSSIIYNITLPIASIIHNTNVISSYLTVITVI
uniref:Uncharacterized protein n=1 Tax=viral metagenome TaxID=1070528 RepID=A0A6C0BN53_9ZZZZ